MHKTQDFAGDALRGALTRRVPAWAKVVLLALASAVFYGFAMHARYAKLDDFGGNRLEELTRLTATVYTAIFAIAYGVQLRVAKRQTLGVQLVLAVLTGVILLGKISLLDYVSDDYDIFLEGWIYSYSELGLFEGLGQHIGTDYSPPYLYILQLISRVPTYPWQYLVKAASVLADVLLGYAVMRLAGLKVRSEGAQLMIYHLATMLPTVVFNGAYWGQCDAIYTSLCMLGLYLALTGRGARGMALFGVALSFKLQTAFFLPMLLPLWLRGDIKLRHLLLIPGMYMAMMLPALIGGKSLHHVVTVYATQAGQYNFMSMNGPTLYNLLPPIDVNMLYRMFSAMGYLLGFSALAALCVLLCVYRRSLTPEAVVLACVVTLAGVPFFLPKMHERYTFGADVMALAACAHDPKRRIALPLLLGFASYICYTAGLPGEMIMDLRWATLFQGLGIALALWSLVRCLKAQTPDAALEVKA